MLVTPLFAALVANDLFTILVAALAATVFANLTSIPRAAIGGLALGVLGAELAGFGRVVGGGVVDHAHARGMAPERVLEPVLGEVERECEEAP